MVCFFSRRKARMLCELVENEVEVLVGISDGVEGSLMMACAADEGAGASSLSMEMGGAWGTKILEVSTSSSVGLTTSFDESVVRENVSLSVPVISSDQCVGDIRASFSSLESKTSFSVVTLWPSFRGEIVLPSVSNCEPLVSLSLVDMLCAVLAAMVSDPCSSQGAPLSPAGRLSVPSR